MLIVGGCASSPDEPAVPAGDCELVITVNAATDLQKTPSTRADLTWGDPYPDEEGLEAERAINLISLYLVTDNGVILTLSPTEANGADGVYHYKTKVNLNSSFVEKDDLDRFMLTGKVVALANLPNRAFPGDPFNVSPFSINAMNATGFLPMWGVLRFDRILLEPNMTVDVGEIKMLRSVPKITVEIHPDFKEKYEITSIAADQTDYYTLGRIEPADAESATATTALSIEGCFNPDLSGDEGSTPLFHGLENGATDRVWCYTTERNCPASSTSGGPLSFTVTLRSLTDPGEPDFSGKIYLCDYTDGKPDFTKTFPRLVRNHDYVFRLSLTPLDFIVDVEQWKFGGKVHLELE